MTGKASIRLDWIPESYESTSNNTQAGYYYYGIHIGSRRAT